MSDQRPDPHAEARAALVAHLGRNGITDAAVLDAIARVPREVFLPQAFQGDAYRDTALPIAEGQTISQPYIVALMTQALGISRRDIVLEVGTGSGYQAVVLSLLCRRVFTMERKKLLLDEAEAVFRHLGLNNITTLFADGFMGWADQAPFNRIIVTAAAHDVPHMLVDQLSDGGVLVAPIGDEVAGQTLVRVTKDNGATRQEDLCAVRFVPMLDGIETGTM